MTRPRFIARDIELFAARSPTLPPASHTNSYALGERQVLIVEAPPIDPTEQRALIEWVQGIRSSGRHPVAVLLTHHHGDHVGAAHTLCSATQLPLWAHPETAKKLPNLRFDRHLNDGEQLHLDGIISQRWKVLHTPGHAPGHLCLHEPNARIVVLGDMVSPLSTIIIAPGDGHMKTYLDQLNRLAALDAVLGLAAHGDPVDKPSSLIRATHAHRLMREKKLLSLLRQSSQTSLDELLPEVYIDTPVHLFPIARLSLRAHLEKLIEDHLVQSPEPGSYRLV